MRQRHFIDSSKGATALVVLGLIACYHQWDNPTAWVYLGLHGTYGYLWVIKSRIFGDRQWEQPCGLPFGLVIWGTLALYWIAPWIITSRGVRAPAYYLGLCVGLYAFGVFFHFVSDMQKHTALRLRPGLVTDGLWAYSRNPNYFGELLIYAGFGLLAMSFIPLLILGVIVAGLWYPNMRKKDRSLSRYPEFQAYRERTAMFIPFVI